MSDERRVKTSSHSLLTTHHSSLILMEPEISHRCPACGMAVRGTSLFCPQCGRTLKAGADGAGAGAAEAQARGKTDAGLNTSLITPPSNLAETMPGKEVRRAEGTTEGHAGAVGATVPRA